MRGEKARLSPTDRAELAIQLCSCRRGPSWATHFEVPDHGSQAGLCSRLGQTVASIERGSSGVFAEGLRPEEGEREVTLDAPHSDRQTEKERRTRDTEYLFDLDFADPSARFPRPQPHIAVIIWL